MLESVDTTIICRDLAHELSSATNHFIEVLDDQVIDLLRAQKRFGHSVELVGDVNWAIRMLQFASRLGQAAIATGDIIHSDNIRRDSEQFSGGFIGRFVGVFTFDDFQDFDAFKLLAHNRTKPDFAIFMAAVGEASNDDGHLGSGTPVQVASHQVGSDVAGRSIINAQISRTSGGFNVRNQSDHAHSRLPKAFQLIKNLGHVLADYGKSIEARGPARDRFNHRLIGGGAQALQLQAPFSALLFLDSQSRKTR